MQAGVRASFKAVAFWAGDLATDDLAGYAALWRAGYAIEKVGYAGTYDAFYLWEVRPFAEVVACDMVVLLVEWADMAHAADAFVLEDLKVSKDYCGEGPRFASP